MDQLWGQFYPAGLLFCSVLSFYQDFSYVPTETLREFKQVFENIIYLFESNNCSFLIFFLHRAILFQIYTTSQ